MTKKKTFNIRNEKGVITNRFGYIYPPKKAPEDYNTNAGFDYAVYRANLKNKEFIQEYPTYRNFKARMSEARREVSEYEMLTSTEARIKALKNQGFKTNHISTEERGLYNLYSEMERDGFPDMDKIDFSSLKWDKNDQAYYGAGGLMITFNFGDEYHIKGLYNVAWVTPGVI